MNLAEILEHLDAFRTADRQRLAFRRYQAERLYDLVTVLTDERKAQGISLRALAVILGTTSGALCDIEHRRSVNPRILSLWVEEAARWYVAGTVAP